MLSKRMFSLGLALLSASAVSIQANAQDWPKEPVKIVVSAAAGGPIDVFGRIMAERLTGLPPEK